MKNFAKFMALLLVFATLFTVTACKKKVYFDEDEYNKQVSINESKSEKEQSERSSKIDEDMSQVEQSIGKTEKNKKIIVKLTYGEHTDYEEILFDKNGIAKEKNYYKYYNTEEMYKFSLEQGSKGNQKLVDHDDTLLMIKYTVKDFGGTDYDTLLDSYKRKDAEICDIIGG